MESIQGLDRPLQDEVLCSLYVNLEEIEAIQPLV
jgi:hypothetical protein